MDKYQIYDSDQKSVKLEVDSGWADYINFAVVINGEIKNELEISSVDDIERLYEQLGTWISYHKV